MTETGILSSDISHVSERLDLLCISKLVFKTKILIELRYYCKELSTSEMVSISGLISREVVTKNIDKATFKVEPDVCKGSSFSRVFYNLHD